MGHGKMRVVARIGWLASGVVLVATACGSGSKPPAETPSSQASANQAAQPDPSAAAPDERFAPPPPEAPDSPGSDSSASDAAAPEAHDAPAPEARGDASRRAEYARTEAEIARLSRLLTEKNREVVERFGRNDTPEALRVLTPIREQLHQAKRRREQLLCWDQPLKNPRATLEQMGIGMNGRRADSRWVDAYIEAKQADRDLDAQQADDLRFVLSKAGHGVMNPSSLGAGTINRRIAQALTCFGLSGPPHHRMTLPEAPPVGP